MRLCFFFFQAEDGIRDRDVTGVQTCALPISYRSMKRRPDNAGGLGKALMVRTVPATGRTERRLGTQYPLCSKRWSRWRELEARSSSEQIGRASCRERVEIAGETVGLEEKREQ